MCCVSVSPGQEQHLALTFKCWVDEWLFQLWALSSDPRACDSQNILHGEIQKFQCMHVSVQFSSSVVSNSLWPYGLQYARLPCPSPTPKACSNSCPSSQWCHPTISFSVIPFSSCLQSFPASRSFPTVLRIKWPKYWSFSFSIGPYNKYSMNIPLGLTSLMSLQSKGPSRVFSNTTVQKHQFFSAQLSLWSNSHIHFWLLEKP